MARRRRIRAPKNWWRRRPPAKVEGKACFRRKTDALNVFRQTNQRLIDELGGETTPIDDELNQQGVKTLADAMWAAMDTARPPYCLEDIDIPALNDLSLPGLETTGFVLPDEIQEQIDAEAVAIEYEDRAIDEGVVDQCFTIRRAARSRRFAKPTAPVPPNERERLCVCRDSRGRFATCEHSDSFFDDADDVPF